MNRTNRKPIGRGAAISPPSRFSKFQTEPDWEHALPDEHSEQSARTEFVFDSSRNVVTENESPDVGFRYSLNPYRGCEHGCPYCYARQFHEYFGWSAGLEFETRILVKENAPELFRKWVKRLRQCEPVAFSGATDCYQPAERRFVLTRRCLEVALEAKLPVYVVTKNALLLRDLDVLSELARQSLVHVSLSINSLNDELVGKMEPRTSRPQLRLEAGARLVEAGVPVQVLVAPVIPGLNDHEIPAVLRAAREAGIRSAAYSLVRLPPSVQPIFLDWLKRTFPGKSRKVEQLIRATHGGELDDPRFLYRMTGTGELAEQIRRTFEVFRNKLGLAEPLPALNTSHFRPLHSVQRRLSFDG